MKILITSALPYVNNVPHLGNIIGCVLSADVFSRYCKSRNYDCIYVCGTDEYGTATEIKALEEKITPQEVCDKYYKIHKEIYEWFGVKFDIFGRTSTEKHKEITQDIFKHLHKNGYIVEDEVEQFYDEKAGLFLADRYIEGTCSYCKAEGARSDQCDKCGKLLQHGELLDPISKVTKTTPVLKKTKHLFINLPEIEKELAPWIEKASDEGFWSENSLNIARSWLKEGLKKRAITRDLKWGVPVPLEGFEDKVFYVWFDAPIGYISITANLTEQWKDWWMKDDVKLYQFMGKDNVPFHTVIFPSTLIGSRQDWTLLHHINTTEFLNYEDGKFSKSRHVGVFGDDAMNSGIAPDVWRYYLLINRPEQADTNFLWDDFTDKNNNELLANIGNLVNRTTIFIKNNFEGKIPAGEPNEKDREFLAEQSKFAEEITQDLEKVKIKEGLHRIMQLGKNANKYFQDNKPWELVKTDKERAGVVLRVLAGQVKDIAILVEPYLPHTSAEIFKQLAIEPVKWDSIGKELPAGHVMGSPKPLFKKLDKKEVDALRAKFAGKIATDGIKFKVTEKAAALGIKAAAAIIDVKKISNKNSELEKLKEQSFEVDDSGYVELHKRVGAEGEGTSVRWLYETTKKTGKIANINTVVDSYNLISLKSGIAAGAHDISYIKGDVRVDVCRGDEQYTAMGDSKVASVKKGEYAFLDDEKVLCRLEIKQCEQTKITKNTKRILLYFEGNAQHTQEQVTNALVEACELIGKTCEAKYQIIYPKGEIRFSDLDLEVGEIISAEKHPDAEKLFVEKVKLGDGERQLVSGLAGHYLPENLVGKKVVVLKNLATAKLRGVESQGMLLAAEGREKEPMHDGKAAMEQNVLEAIFLEDSKVGDKIFLKGEKPQPKKSITFKEFRKIKIEVLDFFVLSEGKSIITESGEELKVKNVKRGIVG